jgi:protein ImuB
MPVGGARALVPDLRVLARRPEAEREALERLAAWCGGFSPEVSLEPPRALALEAAGSLRLFGGAASLLEQVRAGLTALGYRARLCLAPTPGGALVLAALGRQGVIASGQDLRAALAELPIGVLDPGGRVAEDFARMGLRRLGDLLSLPAADLAGRLGTEGLLRLRRLLGDEPDPRRRFEPPERYRGRLELPAELQQVDGLLFPCRRLLDELAGYLLGRGGGVQRLDWSLEHAAGEATRFALGAARPLWQAGSWLELLRERLGRLRLGAPVRAVSLDTDPARPLAPENLALFPDLGQAAAPDPALLDRLRARLGREAVRGLALVSDHRPERAWRWCSPGEGGSGSGRTGRPLWLLDQPRPLEVRDRRPWWGGALDLGQERERIETGWWDGGEVSRDYFVATSVRGERLWVYRERGGWFLHGIFG